MTIRPFYFAEDAPSLERVVEHAEALGGLRFHLEEDIDSIDVEFTEIDGSVNISRGLRVVTVHGPWSYAPVLLDLFDVAIRDLGGVQELVSPRDLPLPLTKEFLFEETTKSRVRVRRTGHLSAVGLAVVFFCFGCWHDLVAEIIAYNKTLQLSLMDSALLLLSQSARCINCAAERGR